MELLIIHTGKAVRKNFVGTLKFPMHVPEIWMKLNVHNTLSCLYNIINMLIILYSCYDVIVFKNVFFL